MDSDIALLIIPGSVRTGSWNLKLAGFAAVRAHDIGCKATTFDLRELALPVYDGDIETNTGIPSSVYHLQRAILNSDAVLVVTPEYNGFRHRSSSMPSIGCPAFQKSLRSAAGLVRRQTSPQQSCPHHPAHWVDCVQ